MLWLLKGLGRGGAEQLVVDSVPHLDPTVAEVEVAYVLPWKNALVPELERQGVRVHLLGGGAGRDPRWLARLARLVRTGGFDVIHTHMPLPAVAARLTAPRRVRFVHTEHNLWSRYRRPTAWANALTYGRNARALAVSSAVASSIRPLRSGRPPVEVLVHGIDVAAILSASHTRGAARALLGIDEAVPVIGTVGNFTAKKDHRTLLEAFAHVAGEHGTAVLVLVGTGPQEAAVRRMSAVLGLEHRVRLLGSRPDVPALLPGFDVFALSSRYEGLPIALLEAMAAGVACVATSVGGVPEVVEHGRSGLLVSPGDPAALGTALAKVLEDGELRASLGAAGAQVGATYDIAPSVRRTMEIYRELAR